MLRRKRNRALRKCLKMAKWFLLHAWMLFRQSSGNLRFGGAPRRNRGGSATGTPDIAHECR